ncbi:hypothetical protein CERZMDRAFT_115902 [Cercospora zeae-maydis SCOH1-5]|uniref:Homing endonuclease LAGLIDADG domain-containing protein n=1 Tax=Cercospora zeae-maydis SCOH1-5 TaxID=717836 RepID=A0A6A6EV16_9PEZI|nr:hypothetical protein CERZMDRAFT_115902 [Cercospora zeae-maydis SCOH1-5]
MYILSAGNFSFRVKATAISQNTYNRFENLPLISEHVGNHKSNLSDEDFGYFLAGLIEGDEGDTSLAYYIKKRIAYGNVYKIKSKKAVRYICKHNLAGFTQAHGCFHVSVVNSKTHKTGYSVRLEYSLKQNDDLALKLLYDVLKMGNLSKYATGISCYKSSGFKTAHTLINYFDKYNVFAEKYKDYLKFRKVYIMITEGKHLEKKGVKKIISIASKGSSETRTQEI